MRSALGLHSGVTHKRALTHPRAPPTLQFEGHATRVQQLLARPVPPPPETGDSDNPLWYDEFVQLWRYKSWGADINGTKLTDELLEEIIMGYEDTVLPKLQRMAKADKQRTSAICLRRVCRAHCAPLPSNTYTHPIVASAAILRPPIAETVYCTHGGDDRCGGVCTEIRHKRKREVKLYTLEGPFRVLVHPRTYECQSCTNKHVVEWDGTNMGFHMLTSATGMSFKVSWRRRCSRSQPPSHRTPAAAPRHRLQAAIREAGEVFDNTDGRTFSGCAQSFVSATQRRSKQHSYVALGDQPW